MKDIEVSLSETELMRRSSAANGDENDQIVLDDEEESLGEMCFIC